MVNLVVCSDDCMVSEYVDCCGLEADEEKKVLEFDYRGGHMIIIGYRWYFVREARFYI